MTKNMPSGAKKYHEHSEPEISTLPSSFLFFLLWSSLDMLVQNCIQHFTLSSAPAHCFFTTLKSQGAVQWRTMVSLAMPFSSLVHKAPSNNI